MLCLHAFLKISFPAESKLILMMKQTLFLSLQETRTRLGGLKISKSRSKNTSHALSQDW